MEDSSFLEDVTLWNIAVLQIKALGGKLRVQQRTPEPSLLGVAHQELEDASADTFTATFAQDRHPANLYVVLMGKHSAAADRDLPVKRERMKRMCVFGIHFDFFRHVLFFDEDQAPDCPRPLHLSTVVNRNHFDLRCHRLFTSANFSGGQIGLSLFAAL